MNLILLSSYVFTESIEYYHVSGLRSLYINTEATAHLVVFSRAVTLAHCRESHNEEHEHVTTVPTSFPLKKNTYTLEFQQKLLRTLTSRQRQQHPQIV